MWTVLNIPPLKQGNIVMSVEIIGGKPDDIDDPRMTVREIVPGHFGGKIFVVEVEPSLNEEYPYPGYYSSPGRNWN
jgi:hypothetical protein